MSFIGENHDPNTNSSWWLSQQQERENSNNKQNLVNNKCQLRLDDVFLGEFESYDEGESAAKSLCETLVSSLSSDGYYQVTWHRNGWNWIMLRQSKGWVYNGKAELYHIISLMINLY